jgi:hypothetical protein
MARMWRRCLVLGLAILLWAGCRSAPTRPVLGQASEDALRTTVAYLAAPQREGRGLGSAGLEQAGEYIAGYLQTLGLRPPPGADSLFQPFEFTTVNGPSPECRLTLGPRVFVAGRDVQAHPLTAERDFAGGVVFAGYGIAGARGLAEGRLYDDYAGLDVRGRVVLVMAFEPHTPDGRSRLAERDFSAHAAVGRKAREAAARGAAALLVVMPPLYHREPPLPPFGRRQEEPAGIPILHVTPAVAGALLEAAGAPTLARLQEQIDGAFAPASRLLEVHVEGWAALDRTSTPLHNVVAWLPGRGPLRDEYIVIGAHYDHLGLGGIASLAGPTARLHPGADDNASGVAVLLESARLLAGAKLSRSVLLVAFSGEERGLLGSRHFVARPPVPREQIRAMINLDMVGRLRDNTLTVGGLGTAEPFPTMVRELTAAKGFTLREAYPDGRAPTDSIPFVEQRIPTLLLWTGYHADYHRPSDTAEKINYDGLRRIADLAAELCVAVASLPSAELRYTAPTRPASAPGSGATRPAGPGVSLGVVPDPSASVGGGVRLAAIHPGSAAEQAGLREGDVITAYGDTPIADLYDLSTALDAGAPDVPVVLRILREGLWMEVPIVPSARRARP